MAEGDDLRAIVEELAQKIEIDSLIGRQLADAEPRTLSCSEHLPRDEVRVMIERRHHDLIASVNVRRAPRSGDEIQPLGGTPGEDQAVGVAHAEEFGETNA